MNLDLVYDNIIFNLQQTGGISSYWSQLLKRLQRDHVHLKLLHNYYNSNVAAKELIINPSNILSKIKKPLIFNRFYNPKLGSIKKKFVFHSSYNRICLNKHANNIVTIHDLIHEKFYSGARRTIHSFQKEIAIKKAKKIITVSKNTKVDLLNYYPYLNPEQVEVIYNGVSNEFKIIETKRNHYRPYLIFIGSRQHYKNFKFAVQIIKETNSYDLFVVGKEFSNEEKNLLRDIAGKYKLFTNISNQELNELYNKAEALIYPSSYEGFGLPLLEAMMAGLPSIAYNASSIPEVVGNAGILLEELDINSAKAALENIQDNRNYYVNNGLRQASKFSWEQCYQSTLHLYNTVYSE